MNMKIVLYGAIGLALGLGVGTGVSAMKHKKVLTAELVARQDSIAAAEAKAEELDHGEGQDASHAAAVTNVDSGESPDGAQAGFHEEGISGAGVDQADGKGEAHHPSESPVAELDSAAVNHLEGNQQAGTDSVAAPDSASGTAGGEAPTGPVSASMEAGAPQTDPDRVPPQGGAGPQASEEGPMRLAKIFGAMDPDEAAKVLENLEDAEVQSILKHISDRKVAAILSNFQPARAATLSRVVMGLPPIGGGDGEGGKKADDDAVSSAGAGSDPDSGVGSGVAG